MKTKNKFKVDEITLVLIVAVIALIVSFYDNSANADTIDAQKITALILDDHEISFANNGIIDENKLKEIKNMDYIKLKSSIGAKKDFCVFIEDDKGNIILAKGSSKLSKDGLYCTE
ncbi:hypothetical protein HY637_01385 [Candidatus Woesearchaeota archaeon]|nr:hypothetical protein [Candidatus Woesearchaeota archaeon]